jgi:hypothetical protein
MSFLDKVPVYIEDLEVEISQLDDNRLNIEWGHECDCEYCDRQGEGDDGADEQAEQIDKEIKAKQRMIKRLEAYAQMFDTPVSDLLTTSPDAGASVTSKAH